MVARRVFKRIVLAIALGAAAAPAAAQQEIKTILDRIQSISPSSTKSDCDAQLAKATTANAFDLFYGAGLCGAAKQKADSSFLLIAGQIRATPDMASMMPATQADAKTVIALYGFIYSYAGGLGDEEVLRDKASRVRLYSLLDQWKPNYGSTYNPGWDVRRRPSEADYLAAIAESAAGRRRQLEEIVSLYSDDIYYALHRQERELYASQGGPVEASGAVAKQMSELSRKMNDRAAQLGLGNLKEIPADEAVARQEPSDFPPDAPGKDERVIDGASDPVAKRCADSAEFSAILENARMPRVLVTTTRKWGTVWRADFEGGSFGPERHVCSAHYDSSRPFEGPQDRLAPLPVPSGLKPR